MDTYAGNEKTLMINTVNIIEKEVIKIFPSEISRLSFHLEIF